MGTGDLVCDVCGKRFKIQRALHMHRVIMHREGVATVEIPPVAGDIEQPSTSAADQSTSLRYPHYSLTLTSLICEHFLKWTLANEC